ncbi:MAG: ATP-binding protein [Micavibrio aeruginosavorus]|nr:ATP-binding protein [Micavibrio aeruginosavorus]
MPPFLAGRDEEEREFTRLLQQYTILENLVLTGLRGVGKTVLLERLKELAISTGRWAWVGTDLSETASLTDEHLALRVLTDISLITSQIVIGRLEKVNIGFGSQITVQEETLNFNVLSQIYQHTPGLIADKLKCVLETCWHYMKDKNLHGVIFAYDEAQNLADHAAKEQYPLSLLLEVFQSLQRKNIPFMLVLTGLPTLFPKLVEARTYSERMFRILFLKPLDRESSRKAIMKPIEDGKCPIRFGPKSVDLIIEQSGGYPYFIQFICREVYDLFIQRIADGKEPTIPVDEITRKLDTDFFAGRWAMVTDRQRQLLQAIAAMDNCDDEFTVQDIAGMSKNMLEKPFGSSQVNQMLSSLSDMGLIYKNRHGKYSLAVPLLARFIRRQTS